MYNIQTLNEVKKRWFFIAYCILIMIYSSNFANLGNFIPLLILPFLCFYLTKIGIDKNFLASIFLLITFSVTYIIINLFYNFNSLDAVLGRLLFPSILFMSGYFIASNDKEYTKTIKILLIVIISTSLFGFLSFLKTLYLFGDFNYYVLQNGRTVINFWGDNPINATGLNTSLSLGIVLLPLVFSNIQNMTRKKILVIKSILLFCFIITVYTAIQLANRTGLLLVPISFIALYITFAEINLRKIISSFGICFIFILGYLTYSLNILNLKKDFQSTLMFQRLSSSNLADDPRMKAWVDAFWGIFSNPMGGRKTHLSLNFAHNLWLDIALDVGVIPFMLLILFSVVSILTLREFLILNHLKFLKALIVVLYAAFYVSFMVEPILQGWVNYFTLFCFLLGIMQRHNFEIKKINKLKNNLNNKKITG